MSEYKPWPGCDLEQELRECLGELAWYREKLKECKEELNKCDRKQKKHQNDHDRKDEEEPKKPRNESDYEEFPGYDDKDDKKRDSHKRRYKKDKDYVDDKDKNCKKSSHEKYGTFKGELQQSLNRKTRIRCGNKTQHVVIIEVKDHFVKAIVIETGEIIVFK